MGNHKIGLSIYRVVLSFLLLKSFLFYLPMANVLFGKEAIFPFLPYVNTMHSLSYDIFAFDFSEAHMPTLFLFVIIFFGILFLFGELGWLSGIILYSLFTILRFRNPFILDGSDNVIQVTLPLLIFADSYHYFTTNYYKKIKIFNRIQASFESIKKIINPFFYWAITIQVAFVYFFTALAKLQGSLWLNGTAVYYTMRVEEFRATMWNIPLTKNYFFVVFSTYFTLLWELSFPYLIWFKQTKLWIIGFGIFFHIGVFIFMRIDNFSWIMIGSYSLFINDTEYRNIKSNYNKMVIFIKTKTKWKNLKTV